MPLVLSQELVLTKKITSFLKAVFGEAQELEASCMKAINKREIDKFRPLLTFMNGKIDDPDIKNVELLAWLIDFEDRPFILGKKYRQVSQPLSGGVEHRKGRMDRTRCQFGYT